MGHMFLVMVDAHSKWLEAHIMSNITATTTIEKLRQVFSTHGLPDSLVSDNATTFTCDLFQEFMRRNGIRHVRSAPFHPASNGLAERAVQTLKEGLKRMTGGTITTKLSRFLFQYRITPQTTTGQAPAVMLMGRKPKAHLDLLRPNIRARVERKQEKQKERHDHHARERQLKPNDTVYIRNFTSSQRWLPGIILSQSGPVSFVVKLTDGRVMRRHQDHLRLRYDKDKTMFSDGTAVGGSIQVEIPQETASEEQGHSVVPAEGDGHSLTNTQPAPVPSDPAPLGHALPVSRSTPGVLRRSQRSHKPPERLTL